MVTFHFIDQDVTAFMMRYHGNLTLVSDNNDNVITAPPSLHKFTLPYVYTPLQDSGIVRVYPRFLTKPAV